MTAQTTDSDTVQTEEPGAQLEAEMQAELEADMQKEKTAEISMEIMTETPEDGPRTLPNSGVDASLHLLSPYLESIHLEVPQLNLTAASINLRAKVQANQKHANERSVRQYGKQRSVKTFQSMQKVSVAVLTLDRASTDDKRIFGRVLEVYEDNIACHEAGKKNCLPDCANI